MTNPNRSALAVAFSLIGLTSGCAAPPNGPPATTATTRNSTMTIPDKKSEVVALLRSIETGETEPVAAIDPNRYVQHNLAVADGLAGFGAVLQQLPKGSARVRTVRVFQDGAFVFAHTDYDFFGPKIGFDVFRRQIGIGKLIERLLKNKIINSIRFN